MKTTLKRFLVTAVLFCPLIGGAQNISVSSANGDTIMNFIMQYLIGKGVYVFDAEFNGKSPKVNYNQIGSFQSNGYVGLQMDSGVVMTTGQLSVAEGPNDNSSQSSSVSNYYTDKELKAITTNSLTSCSTLDFDFVSISPYVSMNYSFGSEEYPEYVCSSFNDIFGFLVTGPDPETGETETWNIAIVPHSKSESKPDGVAVAINTVNIGKAGGSGGGGSGCIYTYSEFYVDNSKGNGSGGGGNKGVQYDGFTQKLSATVTMLPCTKYHMHISVCNAGDTGFDSGVFLEYGSFNSPSAEVNLSHRYADTIERSKSVTLPLTLDGTFYDVGHVSVDFGGTATVVQDYTVLTDSGVNLSTINTTFNLDKNPHWLTFKGTPTADLSQPKLIELYLKTVLCEDYPDLKAYDTIRYVLVEDDVVRLRHDTIVAYDTCHQVGVEVAVGNPTSFHWIPEDDIDFPYQQYSTAMITESRLYQVAAADEQGHTDTTDIYIDVRPKEGIGDVETHQEPSVYPNPANGTVFVNTGGMVEVEVYNANGVKVYAQRCTSDPQVLNIEGLEPGVYALRIVTDEGSKVEKVVVQ